MHVPRLPLLLLALLAADPLPAQGLVVRGDSELPAHMVAFDVARRRLIAVGRQGETREFDGAQWLRRPIPGPRLYGGLCHRAGAGLTLAFGFGTDLLAATWEYDGATWQQRTPAVQPPGTSFFAIAYDLWRDRVVLFGGVGTGGVFGNTWEWDGSNWSLRATTGPRASRDPSMAFDIGRGVCVLFGGQSTGGTGLNGETWEWNGSSWLQRTPPLSPRGRTQAAMAYSAARGRTLLYGGHDGTGLQGDLWEYDGNTWQQVAFTAGPGPLWGHDFVEALGSGETLLVGGSTPTDYTSDVWAWNGTRWLLVTAPQQQPPSLFGCGAAAEPLGGGVLVFGHTFSLDTWRFAGGSWTRQATVAVPNVRNEPAMWSDGTNTWLYGGYHPLAGYTYTDTWRWTANGWQLVRPVGVTTRAWTRVAFDPVRNRAVLFGGRGNQALNDTWTFDGTSWQQQTPTTSPPGRWGHALAFDPARARIVLFGGTDWQYLPLNDTWEWDGANWTGVPTPARPPAYGAAVMHHDPRVGAMILSTAPSSGSLVTTNVEIWSYDGATWTAVPLHEPRLVNYRHALAQDPGTGALLLVDGGSVLELVYDPALAVPHGADCGPGSPRLAGREHPSPGNTAFGLDVIGAPPLGLVAVGGATMPGSQTIGACTLLLQPPLEILVAPANGAGFATFPIPVPAQPALLGSQWYFQAAVVQPAGLRLSAALRVVVGR